MQKIIVELSDDGSTIRCDGYSAYNKLVENGYQVDAENYDSKDDSQRLKWLHIIISNAKAFIAGTYYGLSNIHLVPAGGW